MNQRTQNFPPALIEIRCSLLLEGQIGLFAIRSMKKGTIIGLNDRLQEQLYSWSDYEQLDKQTKKMVDKFCASTKDGFWAPDDINYIPLPFHMNHCCTGNVAFDEDDNFVTIRDVSADEEFCFDYGLLYTNPNFRLDCGCGKADCRGIITGNDWKDPVFRLKNIHMMQKDMRALCLQEEAGK
jgi:uncharacterized protein